MEAAQLNPPDGTHELLRRVNEVLRSRRATRAYKPDPVPRQMVLDILDAAAYAPSNSNTQPWHVHVLSGASMQVLAEELVQAFRDNNLPPSTHFPNPLPAEYGARQADFAARYYASLGIDRQDAAARARQTERNFCFFGAPVGLIFTIDARLTPHSWLDLGLFVQNVMIAARARGLDSCPQVSFARFHPIVASHLQMRAQEVTACGMALGFGDAGAPVNQVQMPRRSALEFASFAAFEEAEERSADV